MGNTVINLPLESVTLSKTNPRKHFDPEQLTELAESIKAHGVLQPILVRPNGKKFELVVGERRFRASKEAKIKTIPTISRELTDKEAVELQFIENLMRQDLKAIEEARGYQYMIDKLQYTADGLAEKIGKSKAYIYGRLKLANLCKKGQEALEEEVISNSIALLVARIPGEINQGTAIEEIVEGQWGDEAMSFREAKDHIEERYMIRLKGSLFSTQDAKLTEAGPCTTCPKRTGNQKDLYPNTSADVCTDPGCFRAKEEAHKLVLVHKAEAQGKNVLSGKDAAKAMQHNSTLVPLSTRNWEDGKSRTYAELLGKKTPEITLIETPGGLIPTVKRSEADEVLRKKFKWARDAKDDKEKENLKSKKDRDKKAIQTKAFKEILVLVAEKAKKLIATDDYWLFLAKAIIDGICNHDQTAVLVKRREIDITKCERQWGGVDYGKALVRHLEKASGAERRSLIAEMLVQRSGDRDWEGHLSSTYTDACEIYGIDRKMVEAVVKKQHGKKVKKVKQTKQPLLEGK